MLTFSVKDAGPAWCSLQLRQCLACGGLRYGNRLFRSSGVPDIQGQFRAFTVCGEQRGCAGLGRQQRCHGRELQQLLNGRQPKRQTGDADSPAALRIGKDGAKVYTGAKPVGKGFPQNIHS
ncbi:hypothetical protein D3C81_1782020 [compost metagenome]